MQLTNIFAGLLLGAAMSTSVLASPAPKDNTVAMAENIRRALGNSPSAILFSTLLFSPTRT